MQSRKNKVLFVELNEFNADLLSHYSEKFSLTHIQKLLQLKATQTFTEDLYESDYLEPWVQWVSVHTGSPSKEHHIKHLGDVPHLDNEQIWEKLSKEGITSGVWGAMNASRGNAENCLFFLPDPWTASENEYPVELKPLLDILRYASKNYLNTSYLQLTQKLVKLTLFLKSHKVLSAFRKELPKLIKYSKSFKKESFVYISLFDYISTLTFLSMNKKYQPDFALLFLNSLAHLQHHHWKTNDQKSDQRFEYGLTYLDRAMGHLFESLHPNDTLVVANALSQKNTNDEEPWILYRQKDQARFLERLGLRFQSVEAHMTHDAHIFFESAQDKEKAMKLLESITVENEKLFLTESYDESPTKLFYKIIFTKKLPSDAKFRVEDQTFNFFELFESIVQRTGKHVQTGLMLSNANKAPQKIMNHEIFDFLYQACTPLLEKSHS